ncbi:RES family NAD+ phosphorylase [Pseudomonas cichorii]|uniref:RES family NAD+ phosphorylase n=1 Tax=Pseudomonas cichorii TaxID=36746 RepID=UPI000EFFFAEF|nr:RES family NAD+ phosphorylase [Pseudomonas cichorii]
MSEEKTHSQDIELGIQSALQKHPEVVIEIEKGTPFFRVQPTRHKDPVFYNKNSDSRYGDLTREFGVYYVAASKEVAIAEIFQHGGAGPGTPVLVTEIQAMSVHQLATDRTLRVVDVARASTFVGRKLRQLVEAKGQGSEGYRLTQSLSATIMRHSREIDGLLYTSTVFPAASNKGFNLVLFERRKTQLMPVSSKPLMEVELTGGQTAVEFLLDLNLNVE